MKWSMEWSKNRKHVKVDAQQRLLLKVKLVHTVRMEQNGQSNITVDVLVMRLIYVKRKKSVFE